jgi:drug/metabolite transporter (DMT)-like permease
MRLFVLTSATMVAFAANSILNRMALVGPGLDAAAFGSIRLIAGALTLAALVALAGRGGLRAAVRPAPALFLLIYIYGFSFAYESLGAGAGALILFGAVQVTMFTGALAGGERPPALRWAGAGLALAGLGWLLWPSDLAVLSPIHGIMMAAAGIGWGLYSLAGRGSVDPLRSTAANFALAAVPALPLAALTVTPHVQGIALAVLSGAVTSGLGYALWYAVLPRLAPSTAAVAQLTVPVIALAGGALLLAEPLTPDVLLPAAVVLGGVALSVLRMRK